MATGNYIEEFVAFLGWEVDASELEEFKDQVEDIGGMLKKAALAVAGVTSAMAALTVIVNRTTGANIALAKSIGVSSEFLEAMGGVVRPLGFEMENVADLVEEMNNKIGESTGLGQPMSGVTDSLKILGLEFKSLKELAPEEQFTKILSAAKNLENQQMAVSAVDILMGGEANKVLGFLRSQDEGLLELIERQMRLNLLTDEGRAGAERFNNVIGELTTVIDSAKSEFFGLIGEAMGPMLEQYRDWIVANNEIIKSKISEWADKIGRAVSWVITQFTWFIGKANEVVTMLGGMENALKLTATALMAVFGAKTILAIGTFIKFMKVAGAEALLMNIKAALIPATIAAIIALFILLGEDLYQFFTGGESALGKIGEKISDFLHDNVKPEIADFLGMTPEEFDMAVVKFVGTIAEFFGTTLPDAIISFVDWMGAFLFPFLESIYQGVVTYFSYVIEFFVNWAGTIRSIFKSVGNFIGQMLAAVVQLFNNNTEPIMILGQQIADFFIGLVNGFVDMVKSLPAKLSVFIRSSVDGIKDTLTGIPLIGGLVGDLFGGGDGNDKTETVPRASNGDGDGDDKIETIPRASTGARVAGASIRNSNNYVTNTPRQTNNFNVTQNAGESGQDFAKRVAGEIDKLSARAVKANTSGIE